MKMILFCHILKEYPNAAGFGAFNQVLSSGGSMTEARKAASEAAKSDGVSNEDVFGKGEFKNDYQKIYENIDKPGDAFNLISRGFDEDYHTMKGYTSWSNGPDIILSFVKDNSTGFQKDIAERALQYGRLSEKQAWSVAYEFLRLKDQKYITWYKKETKNI